MMALDGLTDEQYEDRYSRAVYLRGIGASVRDPAVMQSLIIDIMSDSLITLREHYQAVIHDERQREFWDLADWIKFIHEFTYKPGWVMNIDTDYQFNMLSIVLRLEAVVDVPVSDHRLSATFQNRLCTTFRVIAEHVRDQKHALYIIDNMIHEAEDEVRGMWLRRNGKPVHGVEK